MSFDSSLSSSSSIPAASNVKDLAEKKRGNNSAKFEKDKVDVGGQQWLIEVKNEGEIDVPSMHVSNGRDQATRALEVTSDSDLSSGSPTSNIGSVVESNCSGTNFSGSSNGTFCFGNLLEGVDGGELDDWEDLADALAAIDDKKNEHDQKFGLLVENEKVTQLDHLPAKVTESTAMVNVSKQKSENCDRKFKSGVENGKVTRLDQPTAIKDVEKSKPENSQAWRCDGYGFHLKPRPENGQALRHDAFHSKPRPENGQAWRRGDAFCLKPRPGNGQAWGRGDGCRWKPKPGERDPKSKRLMEGKNVTQLDHLPGVVKKPIATMDDWKPKPENGQVTIDVLKPKSENAQARRLADASLPKTLPNLPKKHNYPMEVNSCKNFVSPSSSPSSPSSCPICCEDLDSTDSSFLPCSCGFQICLFCHKRILEEDGRCPGCRKHYDNNAV